MLIRAAQPQDLAVITAIYDHAVRHGTESMANSWDTPMPGRIAPARPITGASRIRSTSLRSRIAAASAAH
jgi:hypothetical protein